MKNQIPKEVVTKDGGIAKFFGRFGGFGSKDASREHYSRPNMNKFDIAIQSEILSSMLNWLSTT